MFQFMLAVLAIENTADILSGVDLLQGARQWFSSEFPKIGKLATCKYCQMLWLSLMFFCVWMPPACLLTALAAHRLATLASEFYDRYLNRAPLSVYVQRPSDQGSGPSQT